MSTTRTLLIDADDTLWENNIYFEKVAGEFFGKLAARGVTEARAQEVLWETEQRNIRVTGYGSQAFCASLHEAACELGVPDLEPWIQQREEWIRQHPIEFMPGVAETMPKLHAANRLMVLTKGSPTEQLAKVERSGLRRYFAAVEVVFEKEIETYREIMTRHGLATGNTWMIGNSPRSDINPAKAAGLGTVFIPYHTPWQHEVEEIAREGETLVLPSFAELAKHFGSG